jgi:hypothetical protein
MDVERFIEEGYLKLEHAFPSAPLLPRGDARGGAVDAAIARALRG